MEKIGNLFGNYEAAVQREESLAKSHKRKGPRNERDELLDFFYENLKDAWRKYSKKQLTKAYVAIRISHLQVRDLHYIKSICLDGERRGTPFSKVFWGSLKLPIKQN